MYQHAEEAAMIVVFDTNVWKSELYLQSPAAAAVRFFLREQKARVGLPEVVRLEVEEHLRSDIKSVIARLRAQHARLLRLFGQLRELSLPAEDAIDAVIAKVFGELGVEVMEIPFSLRAARSSFLKTIRKLPPSDTTQEFKDGVLWSDCVELLEIDDVCLITTDKAFYANRELARGLAPELAAELTGKPHRLTIMGQLSELLNQIRVNYDIGVDSISEQLLHGSRERLVAQLATYGFSLGEITAAERKLFATENPQVVFVEFQVVYGCPDTTNAGRSPATLTIKGDGNYDAQAQLFCDHRTLSETIQFREGDGTDQEVRNSILYASSVMGEKEVKDTIRYAIHPQST
jgi:PIN domain